MMTQFSKIVGLFCLLGCAGGALDAASTAPHYAFAKAISIPGDASWDYLSVDATNARLYLTHGADIVVIDLKEDKIAGIISNTPGVHGFALASALNRGFSSNGRENKSSVVDLQSLATVAQVDTGDHPDGLCYEPVSSEVYVFNGHGESVSVFAGASGQPVATIALQGKPEFCAADSALGRVYDVLEDKNLVAVIDTKKHQVVKNWPIAPGEEGSGLAVDLQRHRLFIGCGGSKTMVMMNGIDGKVLGSVPIGDGVDACAFDPGTRLAFSSCGDGTTTIAQEDAGDTLKVIQVLPTQRSARTMALDPITHRIFLPAAEADPSSKGRRRRMMPGTLKLLVYELKK